MSKEEKKKGEEIVFGENTTPNETNETVGIEEETVTVNAKMFKDFMQKMSEKDALISSMSRPTSEDDIFNPLKDIATEHTLNLSYYNDKLVIALDGKERVDGTVVYVTNKLMEDGENKGQIRGIVTLVYADGKKEDVDQINFLTNLVRVKEVIKSRQDIGKLVEQGEVTQMSWNGRALIPTSTRIMTGYKNQKFIFVVDHKGKEYTISQDVVNL